MKENPEMDAARDDARKDFEENIVAAGGDYKAVADWWKRHYLPAGHKRLAYILMGWASSDGS